MTAIDNDSYTHLLKDTLQLIRMVNRLATIEQTVEGFSDRVCHVLCNKKGYNFVWIALWQEGKFEYYTLSSGTQLEQTVDELNFLEKQPPKCVEIAIKHRRAVSSTEGLFSCNLCSLNHGACHRYGVVYPLRYRNELLGVIGCSIPENAISLDYKEDIKLFEEIATDIAFAINKYHLQGVVQETSISLENSTRILNNQTNGSLFVQDGVIIEVNDILLKLLGYKNEELVGESLANFIDSTSLSDIHEQFLSLFEDGKQNSKMFHLNILAKNKKAHHFDCYITSILQQGKIAYHFKLIDRTESIEMEQELRLNKQRLEVLLSNFPGMAYVAGTDEIWKLQFASKGSFELTEYTPAEFIAENGIPFADIIYPADMGYLKNEYNAALESKKSFDVRYRIVTKSGKVKWVWERAQCIQYRNKDLFEGFIIDISESIAYQNHLKELNDKKQVILDNVPSKICYLSAEGVIQDCNLSLAKTLKVPVRQLVGTQFEDYWVTDAMEIRGWINYTIKNALPQRRKMGYLRGENRKTVHVLVDVVPHILEDNSKGVIFFLTDVSDISRMTDELRKKINELKIANKKAKESDRLKSAFLSTLSHEMRTPMNGILGFASLLKNPRLNEEERNKYSRIIKDASSRMLTTMDNIIEMSKIQTSLIEPKITSVDIAAILSEIIDNYQKICTTKGLLLVYDNSISVSNSVVDTDERMFVSIVNRLLNNAVRFTNEGSIMLSCKEENCSIQLSIKDTGIGIHRKKLNSIFKPFTHGGHKLSDNAEGVGLGLSIVKAYAEMLGGSVSVESERLKGTEFNICLPKVDSDQEKNHPSEYITCEGSETELLNSGKRILISESDNSANLYLRYYLESQSYVVVAVSNLQDTIMQLKLEQSFDLVIVNPHFSQYRGEEILVAIRDVAPFVPLIIQTTSVLDQDKKIALRFNTSSFLVKPYSEKQLETALDIVFENKRVIL